MITMFPPASDRPIDVLLAALKSLGGIGQIQEITKQCEVLGHPQPGLSVRRLLQEYSSSADWPKAQKPRNATDLFYSLDETSKRTGYWGLRGFAIEAPDEYPVPDLARAYESLLDRADTPLGKNRPAGIAYKKKGNIVEAIQVGFAPDSPYLDRLLPDGRIEHIGEGREEEQKDTGGNRGMLGALENGRWIPVFQAIGQKGEKRYADLGLYRVVHSGRRSLRLPENDYETDAFVFTLEPASRAQAFEGGPDAGVTPADRLYVESIPVEEHHVQKTSVSSRAAAEAVRRESVLVRAFIEFAKRSGGSVKRWKITPRGETEPLYTDPYVEELHLLVEAKGRADRTAVRMAIGQLADYRRALNDPKCAILLPLKPSQDLLELAATEKMEVIWPSADDFEGTLALW